MRAVLRLPVVLALLLTASACGEGEEARRATSCPTGFTEQGGACVAEAGTIAGTAHLADQQAHGGIEVRVLGTDRSASTSDSGLFELGSVPPGLWDVELRAPGYAPIRHAGVAVAQGRTVVLEPRTLERETPATVTIRGTIRLRNAASHAGTTVLLEGTSHVGLAGADGSFLLLAPPGRYRLVASHPGYEQLRLPEVEIGGSTFTFDDQLLEPAPATSGQITGTILLGGLPQAAATVFLSGTSLAAHTAADGSFTLDEVPAGLHTLVAAHPGYVTATSAVIAEAGATTDIGQLNLAHAPDAFAGSLVGHARRFGEGSHEGITLALEGPILATFDTAADGAFRFDELSPGTYTLTAIIPRGPQVVRTNLVVAGGTLTLPDLLLRPARPIHDGAIERSQPLGNGDLLLDFAHEVATTLYRGADSTFAALPGRAELHAASAHHSHVSIAGVLHRMDRVTGEAVPVFPRSAAVIGQAEGHVFYLREPNRIFRVGPGSTEGISVGAPNCATTGPWTFTLAPFTGTWWTVEMEGSCEGVAGTQRRSALVDLASGIALPAAAQVFPVPDGAILALPGTEPGTFDIEWASFSGGFVASRAVGVRDLFVGSTFARWRVGAEGDAFGEIHAMPFTDFEPVLLASAAAVETVFPGGERALLTSATGQGWIADFAAGTARSLGSDPVSAHPLTADRLWLVADDGAQVLSGYDAATGDFFDYVGGVSDVQVLGDIATYVSAGETHVARFGRPGQDQFLCTGSAARLFRARDAPVLGYVCGPSPVPQVRDLDTGSSHGILASAASGTFLSVHGCSLSPSGTRVVCSYEAYVVGGHPWSCYAGATQFCTVAYDTATSSRRVLRGDSLPTSIWSPSEDAHLALNPTGSLVVGFGASPTNGSYAGSRAPDVFALGDGGRWALAHAADGGIDWIDLPADTVIVHGASAWPFSSRNEWILDTTLIRLTDGVFQTLPRAAALRWYADDGSAALAYDGRLLWVTPSYATTVASSVIELGHDLYLADTTDGQGRLLRLDRQAAQLVEVATGIGTELLALGAERFVLFRDRDPLTGTAELVRYERSAGSLTPLAQGVVPELALTQHGERLLATTRSGGSLRLVSVPLDGSGATEIGPAMTELVSDAFGRIVYVGDGGLLWAETPAGADAIAEADALGTVVDAESHLLFTVASERTDLPRGTWRADR
ncbi:carboxypeptidase regulatory-like domain-containing protein [Vulgatibacter sp.]|uniref:carboxypeptidase regulatory-like domain-containing protein n=1 Tax=Vulgatibacter sp. TaxID=1971226 RepID=UPI00356991EA